MQVAAGGGHVTPINTCHVWGKAGISLETHWTLSTSRFPPFCSLFYAQGGEGSNPEAQLWLCQHLWHQNTAPGTPQQGNHRMVWVRKDLKTF